MKSILEMAGDKATLVMTDCSPDISRAAGLENDEYVRQIDGYLPTSEVAFIDEIFKANSAILNALLTPPQRAPV